MRKISFIAMLLPTLFLTFGCKNKYKTLTEEFEKSYTYDGKQIEMEGYLIPGSFSMVGKYVKVDLCGSSDPTRNRDVINSEVNLLFGKEPNSMYFPDKFSIGQVELYDNTGKKITTEDKVKITGTVEYTAKGPKKTTVPTMLPDYMKEKMKKEAEEDAKKGDGNDYSYTIKNVVVTKL